MDFYPKRHLQPEVPNPERGQSSNYRLFYHRLQKVQELCCGCIHWAQIPAISCSLSSEQLWFAVTVPLLQRQASLMKDGSYKGLEGELQKPNWEQPLILCVNT